MLKNQLLFCRQVYRLQILHIAKKLYPCSFITVLVCRQQSLIPLLVVTIKYAFVRISQVQKVLLSEDNKLI